MTDAVQPQHLVLVLPSTAEYDSRTYRIASSLAARGHTVTVLARQGPGLAAEESHPAGYRIIRVPVSTADGLPLPGSIRRRVGRWWARRSAGSGDPPADDAPRVRKGEGSVRPSEGGGDRSIGAGRALTRLPGRMLARARGALRGAWRLVAIGLTVRSQTRALLAADPGADVYHAMAYMGIPVGLALRRRRGGRVVYDARDIYVDARNLARLPRPLRRLLGRIERGWARAADRVVTVNRPYAEVMAGRWSVELPLIVMNCAYRFDPPAPAERRFHTRLGLAVGMRVVLYQGGFSPDRGIEQLLAAIDQVPDAALVFMGYGTLGAELAARASSPELAGRVFVLPAVAPAELLGWVAAADVVAMPIQPVTLNHRLTTPNKLFEAMAAGVPVVAADLPGMAAIVRETGCGVLCDPTDPGAIASAIRSILDGPPEERDAFRARALAAAHGAYSWEAQVERLLALYGELTGRPW